MAALQEEREDILAECERLQALVNDPGPAGLTEEVARQEATYDTVPDAPATDRAAPHSAIAGMASPTGRRLVEGAHGAPVASAAIKPEDGGGEEEEAPKVRH